jgi:hypothetical protein
MQERKKERKKEKKKERKKERKKDVPYHFVDQAHAIDS